MTKHTPGPWEQRKVTYDIKVGKYPVIAIPISGQGMAIGCVYQGAEGTLANARLIAAAPELLEACRNSRKALIQLCEKGCGYEGLLKEVEQAIAKAEGK